MLPSGPHWPACLPRAATSLVLRVPDFVLRSDHRYSGNLFIELSRGAAPQHISYAALLLGLGGLQRERANGTALFTLSLPVGRAKLVAVRAGVGSKSFLPVRQRTGARECYGPIRLATTAQVPKLARCNLDTFFGN